MSTVGQEKNLSVGDISRLLEIVTNVAEQDECSPSEAIRNIAETVAPGPSRCPPQSAVMADFVGQVRRLRLRRNELLGAPLFRDPAWDMLLELFVAHECGRKVSVSSLCYASGVPPTTALRQLSRLEEHGLVVREGDCSDHRRRFVRATPKAIAGIAAAAAALMESCGSP